MTWLDHRQPVPAELRGAIVALGNFDGFHLGHQKVVAETVAWAKSEGRPVIVATFDPHPVRHFAPHIPPFRLTTLPQRYELFRAAGADAMLVFHFDDDLANMTAEDFVTKLLGDHVGAAGVVTGNDFTYGKDRGGNCARLATWATSKGIIARTVDPVLEGGAIISSSRIRDSLKAGEVEVAAKLMTRPFALRATVQHGDKRGREIGFPTANMDIGHYLRPRYGIYAITARIIDTGQELKGAANMGVRPTFQPPKELLEPHYFDFKGDLYGREVEVRLHHFLRPEIKFDSLDALMAQMAADCEKSRILLG